MTQELAQVDTPIGIFCAVVIDGAIRTAGFLEPSATPYPTPESTRVRDTLAAYFAGDTDALDTLSVAPDGTAFKRLVWKALREVRAGETIAYGKLAARVGAPGAARAVGTANATNPIALVIPCHRVVRAGGDIGNYGFGVERKRWLIDHEARPHGLFAETDSAISTGAR